MLPSDPIFKIDDSFIWINLRRYNRQQLKNNELAEDIAAQIQQNPGIGPLIQDQKLLLDSMYEGHNRDDYNLAQQNLAQWHWYSDQRCVWINNVFDRNDHTTVSLPARMVNHCGFLDHVRNQKIDWNGLTRTHILLCLMRRPTATRSQICKYILDTFSPEDYVLSYGSAVPAPWFDDIANTNLPILLDGNTNNGDAYHLMSDPRAFGCLVNLVAETSDQIYNNADVGYASQFITEKTFKAFAWYQIPVWSAVPGTVQRVRELGFDVFDDWVNHDYDVVEDYTARLDRCLGAVKNLVHKIQVSGIQQVHQTLMPRFIENDVVLNRCQRRTRADFDQGLKRLQLKGQL
jgi:hypothetical protein